MIHALHLIWIIPLSVWFGLFVTALMVVAKTLLLLLTRKQNDKRITPTLDCAVIGNVRLFHRYLMADANYENKTHRRTTVY